MDEFFILLMLLTANGSPILAARLLGRRCAGPLDRDRVLGDGRPLLGPSKTLRGVITALATTTLLGLVLGYPWSVGLIIGALAMLGDALSSFIKRRRGIPSGGMAPGLDQVPESLFPLLACRPLLGLSWVQVLALTLLFVLASLLLSRLLFRLGIRDHPY